MLVSQIIALLSCDKDEKQIKLCKKAMSACRTHEALGDFDLHASNLIGKTKLKRSIASQE